jgi:hypothetical protein
MMMKRIAPALLILTLVACSGDEAKKAEGAGTVEGEILPGSANDAMIPLDSVKSQAPLAPKVEGADKKDAKAKAADKSATVAPAAVEPAAEPEPAAEE